jgi:hypothetical protein
MIKGIEAKWQGLNITLTIPHKKHPAAAIMTPPDIQASTTEIKLSNTPALPFI